LDHALRTILELMTEHKKLFLFVYTESKHLDRKHLQVILDVDDKHIVGFWRRLIREAKGGAITEKELDLAANFVAYALVFLALRGWNLRRTTLSENVDFVTNFVLKGLGMKNHG